MNDFHRNLSGGTIVTGVPSAGSQPSPSSQAAIRPATEEYCSIPTYAKTHLRVYKNPPLGQVLSHVNPLQSPFLHL